LRIWTCFCGGSPPLGISLGGAPSLGGGICSAPLGTITVPPQPLLQVSQQSLRWNRPLQKSRKRWLDPQPQLSLQPVLQVLQLGAAQPLKQLGRAVAQPPQDEPQVEPQLSQLLRRHRPLQKPLNRSQQLLPQLSHVLQLLQPQSPLTGAG